MAAELSAHLTIDYLISGFRISIGPDSTTPGPRTHIRGLCNAWVEQGAKVRPFLVSSVPGLRRFAGIPESSYSSSSNARVWIADYVRMAASVWAGVVLWTSSIARPAPTVIIERGGVLQSLVSFHPKKRRAIRVIEVNGIASRETAIDRNVLKHVRLATALEQHVFRKADLVIAVSKNLKVELIDFAQLDPDRILVVPNGVSERVANLPRSSTEDCVVGFVGALSAWQHLDRMLIVFCGRLAEMEQAAGRTVRLEIIGDGVDLERLKAARTELGLDDRITFWGPKSHDDALVIMTSWDIGFAGHEKSSSATMYHSPLKIYEYAALGLITVCTYSEDAESLRAAEVPTFYFSSEDEMGDALVASARAHHDQAPSDVTARRGRVRRDHGWGARAARILAAARPLGRDA